MLRGVAGIVDGYRREIRARGSMSFFEARNNDRGEVGEELS